jgi:hypothetical protein
LKILEEEVLILIEIKLILKEDLLNQAENINKVLEKIKV